MCCQMTPAIGQEPMKPMTMRRLRFMGRSEKGMPNAQRPTPNVQLGQASELFSLTLGVGCWALDVGCSPRCRSSQLVVELLNDDGWVSRHNDIRRHTLCHHGSGSDH